MLPIFFLVFSGTPSCMGFEDPTLAVVNACPAATAALGAPITRSWVGVSCGNAETEDAFGHASWRFPVSGPNGSGVVNVVTSRSGGPWIVHSATVDTSAGSFEAVSCAAGAGIGGPSPYIPIPSTPTRPPTPPPASPGFPAIGIPGLTGGAPVHIAATVGTTSPGAPATAGEACTIDIVPAGLAQPCRVDVVCAGRSIYGSTNAMCVPGSRGGSTATDGSSTDGDPVLTVVSESGTGMMSSSSGPIWTLTFTFPPTP